MNIELWGFAAIVFWLPGAAIERLLKIGPAADVASRIALQLALGMAFWPVIFLWTSFLPLHWTGWVVRAVVGVTAASAFLRNSGGRFVRWITLWSALLSAILVVTGWTRLRAVASLVLPPWVDAVHHTMIVRLFLMRGAVPVTYDPFLTDASAFYHWGFHAMTAVLCWFTGRTDPFDVPAVMLSFGQWLNALTPLFVYAAARSLTRSRVAGIVAAALAGLVSYYPAYYVSWGRYTHLAGVLLLLAWIALATRSRITTRSAAALAIVAAGLTLVHVRLAFFAVTFAVIVIVVRLIRRRSVALLLIAAAIAAVLLTPWLIRMRSVAAGAIAPTDSRWTTPTDVHESNLWVPHTAELLSIATAGISGMAGIGPLTTAGRILSAVWWIAVIILYVRRRPPAPLQHALVILAAWCGLTMLILNGTRLQFASNTSAAITAWIPICVAAAIWSAAAVPSLWKRRGMIVIVAICAVIGVRTLSNVINPGTILATEADVAALRWLRNAPPDSTIIGRVRGWYGGAFIGADGAYWASVLTDRRSLPPPSLYRWTNAPEASAEVALFLARWQREYPGVGGSTLEEARKLGVTHVYFGRGVPSFGTIVYARDGVTITRVVE